MDHLSLAEEGDKDDDKDDPVVDVDNCKRNHQASIEWRTIWTAPMGKKVEEGEVCRRVGGRREGEK